MRTRTAVVMSVAGLLALWFGVCNYNYEHTYYNISGRSVMKDNL